MGDKVCNKCGKKGLGWDIDFHSKTGKWKLDNHKTNTGVWCNKPPEKLFIRKKQDMETCPYCSDSSFGLFIKSEKKLNDHIKSYHPNKERLTELDYKMSMGMSATYLRYWTTDPSFHRYKHLYKA